MPSDQLANALTALADAYAREPIKIIGQQIVVSNAGAPAGSTIIGSKIEVHATGRGNVTGQMISVSAGDLGPAQASKDELVKQLRDACDLVKAGTAPQSWVDSILKQIPDYVSVGVKALVTAAANAAAAYYI